MLFFFFLLCLIKSFVEVGFKLDDLVEIFRWLSLLQWFVRCLVGVIVAGCCIVAVAIVGDVGFIFEFVGDVIYYIQY